MRREGLLVAAILGAAALTAPLWSPVPGSVTSAQGAGGAIMERLQAAAAAGDPRASAALDDMRAFLVQKHLDSSVLDAPLAVESQAAAGRVRLTASGLTPFWLDVTPTADLDTDRALSVYLAERRTAAVALATAGGTVQGRLAFAGFVDLERLLDLRDTLGLGITDADVDVWLGDQWITRAGYGPDASSFWRQPKTVVLSEMRSVLSQAHAADAVAAQLGSARLTVHGAVLSASAAAVGQLLEEPDVLLFDPYTDLLAPFVGAAAHVRLVAPIDVFDAWVLSRDRAGEPYPFVPAAANAKGGM